MPDILTPSSDTTASPTLTMAHHVAPLNAVLHARLKEYATQLDSTDQRDQRAALLALRNELTRLVNGLERALARQQRLDWHEARAMRHGGA